MNKYVDFNKGSKKWKNIKIIKTNKYLVYIVTYALKIVQYIIPY